MKLDGEGAQEIQKASGHERGQDHREDEERLPEPDVIAP